MAYYTYIYLQIYFLKKQIKYLYEHSYCNTVKQNYGNGTP